MKINRWLIIAAVLIAAVIVYALRGGFSAGTAVEAARAKVGPIVKFVDEQAKTRLPQTYLITMPITGRIEPIALVEGMTVKKGQVVARIVPRDLQLAVDQAAAVVGRLEASIAENADVAVERTAYQQTLQFVKSTAATVKAAAERMVAGAAKLKYAANDLARVKQLAATGARTQDELERAELSQVQSDVDYKQDQLVHAAMVAVAAATDLTPSMVLQYIDHKKLSGAVLEKQKAEAEAKLRQVLLDQERGEMRSPVDGVVLDRPITNERYLSAGTILLEIGRLEELEIEADVLSLDVVAAKVGNRVEIYGPAVGRAWGKVHRIYPAGFTKLSSLGVEQQRVKVIVRFDDGELERLLAERGLGIGYRVRVKILTDDQPKALLVPRSALFRTADNSWRLFVIRGGRAVLQKVEVGLMNDEQVEIAEGLAEGEGEQVVLAPESSLKDGDKVFVGENK
ncbi:MAG: HlyD family efflux transporter periplasmic adaptor subunit [Pirellulales bacterium]|nr:HlyD family efflux transporter periplasmic adaptor subunit [Pirellulales bacterium]